MNLIDRIGREYFNRRFARSFFYDDEGRPSIIQSARTEGVDYTALTGSSKRVTSTIRNLPHDFFTGLEKFHVPYLGWRSASNGKYLAFFSRNNRSYHRGLAENNLDIAQSAMTRWMYRSKNLTTNLSENLKCLMALKPEFVPFTEGIRAMRAGELVSFAVSPTIAVMPDVDNTMAIYFRQAKAGMVRADDSVVFDVPLLSTYVGEMQ